MIVFSDILLKLATRKGAEKRLLPYFAEPQQQQQNQQPPQQPPQSPSVLNSSTSATIAANKFEEIYEDLEFRESYQLENLKVISSPSMVFRFSFILLLYFI